MKTNVFFLAFFSLAISTSQAMHQPEEEGPPSVPVAAAAPKSPSAGHSTRPTININTEDKPRSGSRTPSSQDTLTPQTPEQRLWGALQETPLSSPLAKTIRAGEASLKRIEAHFHEGSTLLIQLQDPENQSTPLPEECRLALEEHRQQGIMMIKHLQKLNLLLCVAKQNDSGETLGKALTPRPTPPVSPLLQSSTPAFCPPAPPPALTAAEFEEMRAELGPPRGLGASLSL